MMLYQQGFTIAPEKVSADLHPTAGFAMIRLGNGFSVFVNDVTEADALIKAAVEAKRLLSPPVPVDAAPAPSGMQDPKPVARVITDSERTCPEQHPGSGAPCYRDGDHGVHRDPDGEEWRTDGGAPVPQCDSVLPLRHGGEFKCTDDAGHYGAHTAIAGKYRWLGHGDDARDENGDKIAPLSVTA